MLVNNQVQIQRRGDKTDEPKQTGLRQLEIVTKKGCDKQNKTDFMCRFELLFFFFYFDGGADVKNSFCINSLVTVESSADHLRPAELKTF